MYNEKLKNLYIEDYLIDSASANMEKLRQSLVNLFNRLGKYEEESKKDFLQMDKTEIMSMLSSFLCGGKDYQASTLSTLCQYMNWGIKRGNALLNENILVGLPLSAIDVSESYANSMVKDEEDFKECLDMAFHPLDKDYVDSLYRCFLVLIFCGIDPGDVLLLKDEDVNLQKREIYYKGRVISVTPFTHDVLNHVMNMDSLCKVLPKKRSLNYIEIVRHGYVIENTVDNGVIAREQSMRAYFDAAISKKFKDCQRALTQRKIADSGVFYRMYLKEIETDEIDCSEYLFQRRNNIKTIEFPDRVAKRAMQEYLVWKKAFDLK